MRNTVAVVLSWLSLSGACSAQNPAQQEQAELWAFTAPWDPASAASVRRNSGQVQRVITGWIALDSITGRPFVASAYKDMQPLAHGVRRMAIVTSWQNDRFHARSVRALAEDRGLLGESARWIGEQAASGGYEGLVIDFEELEPRDLTAQVAVVRAIRDSARTRGVRLLAVAIPAGNVAAYPARSLLDVADFILVMLYDQHWLGSEPGPISAPDWVAQALAARVAEAGGPDRVVAGLPLYGYRWRRGAATEIVSFDDARRIAAAAGVSLSRDAASFTLRARRPPEWDMWVTDAQLVKRLMNEAHQLGVRRFSFWRLGQEDPAVWAVLTP